MNTKIDMSQKGIAHIGFIVLFVAVLTLVGFAAYRVGSNNDNEQAQNETAEAADLSEPLEQEKQDKIQIPGEAEEAAKVEEPKSEPVVKEVQKTETVEKKKDDKTYLQMGKAQGTQSGAVVNASATTPQPMSGTCNFKLYHEQHDNIYSSNQVTNASQCSGQLSISNLPTYDGWSVHVWFDGSDGKTFAYGDSTPIALTNPN